MSTTRLHKYDRDLQFTVATLSWRQVQGQGSLHCYIDKQCLVLRNQQNLSAALMVMTMSGPGFENSSCKNWDVLWQKLLHSSVWVSNFQAMYIHIHLYTYLCIHTCLWILYIYLFVYVYIYILCICIYIMYMYVHVYKDVCIYTIYYISNILNYIYINYIYTYLKLYLSNCSKHSSVTTTIDTTRTTLFLDVFWCSAMLNDGKDCHDLTIEWLGSNHRWIKLGLASQANCFGGQIYKDIPPNLETAQLFDIWYLHRPIFFVRPC